MQRHVDNTGLSFLPRSSARRADTSKTSNRHTSHSRSRNPLHLSSFQLESRGTMATNPHSKAANALFKVYNVDPSHGLTSAQVLANREFYGENRTSSSSLFCARPLR